MRKKQAAPPPQHLGDVLARRRLELGLTLEEAGRRLRGRNRQRLSGVHFADIEKLRMGMPRLPLLRQLPKALRLDADVVYFWAGQLPPDIKPGGMSEAAVKAAWAALRTTLARRRAGQRRPRLKIKPAELRGPLLRGWRQKTTLGGLIDWRRRELGFTQETLAARLTGETGQPLSRARLFDIIADRYGIPRGELLEQLARALKLDPDVLYLWARRIPPDIEPRGLSEAEISEAWDAFRAVVLQAKRRFRGTRPAQSRIAP